MSFDDFLQTNSFFDELNWNGSSGKLRVKMNGEQTELKLPQTFIVDPKTSQYGWRAWVPQPNGKNKPYDQRVDFTEGMPPKSSDGTVAALEAKAFFLKVYAKDWGGVTSGVLDWNADQTTVFRQLINLGRELQKIPEADRGKKAIEMSVTGVEKVGTNNNPVPAYTCKVVDRPSAFDETPVIDMTKREDDGDFG